MPFDIYKIHISCVPPKKTYVFVIPWAAFYNHDEAVNALNKIGTETHVNGFKWTAYVIPSYDVTKESIPGFMSMSQFDRASTPIIPLREIVKNTNPYTDID